MRDWRIHPFRISRPSRADLAHGANGATPACSFDAEGHAVTFEGINVDLDARGRAVGFLYGPGGGKMGVMKGQALARADIPLPGGGEAVYEAGGLTAYRHSDHLGSAPLASTPSRTVWSAVGYAPFGEPFSSTGSDRSFTGEKQDTIGGQYDFLNREYSPVQGRWWTPDPSGLAAVDPANPQSWNRYVYVNGRPLSSVDPLGLLAHNCFSTVRLEAPSLQTTTAVASGPADEDAEENNDFGYSGMVCVGGNADASLSGGGGGGGWNHGIGSGGACGADGDAMCGLFTLEETKDEEAYYNAFVSPAQVLAAVQDAVRNNPKFARSPSGTTYCNIATYCTAAAMGAPLGPLTGSDGQPATANQMAKNLAASAESGGPYQEVGPVLGEFLANSGQLVIGAWENPSGPGHVFTLRPSGFDTDPRGNPDLPLVNNIGAENSVEYLNYVMKAADRSDVRYYAVRASGH